MKCSGCGNENPEIARFCFSCGNKLTTLAAPRNSAGLRVRAPSGSQDDGLALPTAQLDTSGAPIARGSGTDQALKAVGNAETAPFEPSPLGADTQPEARVGANVADTILDLPRMDELIAEMNRRKKAAAATGDTDFDDEPPPGALAEGHRPSKAARAEDAEPAWARDEANPAATLPPEPATERPISLHDSAGLSAQLRGDRAFEDGPVESEPERGPDTRSPVATRNPAPQQEWEKSTTSDADASSSLFDYEIRQTRKVQWTHRLLIVLLVGFLAGAAYFLYRGVAAMGRATLQRTEPSRTASGPTSESVGRTSQTPNAISRSHESHSGRVSQTDHWQVLRARSVQDSSTGTE